MRVITVVLNAQGSDGLHTPRFKETKKMIDYAYNNFKMEEVYPENYQIKDKSNLSVVKGKEKEVAVATNEPLSLVVKNGEKMRTSQATFLMRRKLMLKMKSRRR